jgi:hypothetical protein
MTRVRRLHRFLWDFVVGDDWRIAVAVTAALLATLLLANSGVVSWWLLPAVVVVMLTVSVWAVARTRS